MNAIVEFGRRGMKRVAFKRRVFFLQSMTRFSILVLT